MDLAVTKKGFDKVRAATAAVLCTMAIGAVAVATSGCGSTSITATTSITGSPSPGSRRVTRSRGRSDLRERGLLELPHDQGVGVGVGPNLTDVGTLHKTTTYTGTLPVPVPGVTGPVYTGIDWFVLHTQCPSCAHSGSPMPPFTSFTPQQYIELATFLNGLGVTYK